MSAEVTRRHVVFPPADTCALGPVKVYGPDGVTLVRTIPVAALRARDAANEQIAEAALRLLDGPEPRRRGPAMTFAGNGRKKKAAV